MADGVLSDRQRKLWRRAERSEGLRAMSVNELGEWLCVCEVMARHSDGAGASKARRLWHNRSRDAEAELAHRRAT